MWQNPKVLRSSAQFLPPPTPTPPTQFQTIPTSPSPPNLKHSKLSRRDLAISTNSSLLLLLASQALDPFHLSKAIAEEPPSTKSNPCTNRTPTKRAFLEVSINGEPIGRIIIGLYGESAPAGTARFTDLVSGSAGVSYRRKEFTKIMPNYVQHGGVRSYGVDAELAKQTGSNLAVERLVSELERANESCEGVKNVARSVSIVVRDPSRPPPKIKLVARKGKLEIDEEEVGTAPNGTEFVIATKDSPELDAAALVVGSVLEGMEVVERIGQVKTVQENTTSPYFRCVPFFCCLFKVMGPSQTKMIVTQRLKVQANVSKRN